MSYNLLISKCTILLTVNVKVDIEFHLIHIKIMGLVLSQSVKIEELYWTRHILGAIYISVLISVK